MIKDLKKQLQDWGFQSLQVKPEEVSIYYQHKKEHLYIVSIVDYHDGFYLEPNQITKMLNKVEDVLVKGKVPEENNMHLSQAVEVEKLCIVAAKHQQGLHEICIERGVWIVDIVEKRLFIYENQPGDFCGLRGVIENILLPEKVKQVPKAKRKKLPIVTILLVVINVIVWVCLELLGDTNDGSFMRTWGAMDPIDVLEAGEWFRIVSSTFLHFGQEHLFNNMLMLSLLGSRLEGLGKIRFIGIYLITGIFGNLLSLWGMIKTADYAVSAGASGCVYGVIGALAAVVILNKGKFEGLTTKGLIFMILLSLYYGFTSAGVDNWAHVGGVISGIILGVIFYWGKCRKD